MPRYSIDLTDDEAKEVKAIAKEEDRTLASALRCLIRRQLQVVKLLENGAIRLESAPICVESAENSQSPTPSLARTGTDSGSKNKKRKEPELAPLDVVERILSDLNNRAGSGFQAKGKVARRLIASRIRDGYEESDFIKVNARMVDLWMGNEKMEHNLNYETLYGPKFEKYVGMAAGGGGPQLSLTERPEQPHERRQREERERQARGE